MTRESCQIKHLSETKAGELKKSVLPEEVINNLAETFKVLGDPTRLKIIHLLSKYELCVCALASVLEVTDSVISHQLRMLRNLRLVKFRKEGQMTYYSLDDKHITHLFHQGLAHVREKT